MDQVLHVHRWVIGTPTPGIETVDATCKGCLKAKQLSAYWNEEPKFNKFRKRRKAKPKAS